MPITSANAKSRSEPDPNTNSSVTGISVTTEVFSERVIVSASDSLTSRLAVIRRRIGMFSRTRSNTITVS